ncbi:LytR/AlgR family response regulator transcription factor [Pedobacter duraquae]|uniref:LytTR family two component transcriptional regulator n=1 Tax=Pedobacter duraquae TaxID=425511 RepID=A0A4R6IJX8_9SPHI|nr:LytTR family DNA-binding domain-containing protein [Pedobacter duraquae]TDO22354.1 LytTR family two component transcriptional regulator [Pedobacter duraquae]
MYNCVIIDDEPHAIAGLSAYIERLPEFNIIKTYLEPLVALREISTLPPIDIIFIDVDMPLMSGIELAKEIRSKTHYLVFTTAHTEYAFEAFEIHADGYLLKPYTLARFFIEINRLFPAQLPQLSDDEVPESKTRDYFFVKNKDDNLRMVKVIYTDIIAVESKHNYVMIYTVKKNVMTYMSLTEIFRTLAQMSDFIQLHRSFVVNKEHIETIQGNTVCLSDGLKFTVGDNFKKVFAEFLSSRMIKTGKRW